MVYFKRRNKGESKAVPLNAEARRAIQEQLRKFREKFGRDAGPEDPIFFDPEVLRRRLSDSLHRPHFQLPVSRWQEQIGDPTIARWHPEQSGSQHPPHRNARRVHAQETQSAAGREEGINRSQNL